MHYFFKPHEANFKEWVKSGFIGIPDAGIAYLKHLSSSQFKPKIELFSEKQWKMQVEAIQRCIYCFEVLGEKDLLTNIVTGGGKTTVIGAMIAYMMMVHDQSKFLILTPNTIVRERLVDDFDPNSDTYIYDTFPFFINSYEPLKDRISLHIMKPSESATGIRAGNIILGNIHQIYERTDNWKVLRDNVESLCIFNDEAHNTKAEQYDDLINKLKPKRVLRLDTTATPDRLDGKHPDSKMIFDYSIAQAMRDKIIKRIVVFHPDVRKVQLTFEDLETGKTISAEEVPWEEIERRKIRATRYITSTNPMRQQIAIALELLKNQRMRTPPKYKPLLFVVAISINDAERIRDEIIKLGEPYGVKRVLLVTNESEEELKDAARDLNKNPQTEYDAVVSVLMLREGWDVRNISVILLFRKFCYKEMPGGQKFSVYGPQVIGRGLRRMSKNPEDWESLFVVDHPILKHKWLWDHLKATEYPEALDPADVIVDIGKVTDGEQPPLTDGEGETTIDEGEGKIDFPPLPPTPEPPEIVEPIYEWQKFLDEYKYDFYKMNITEDIERIKSIILGQDLVTFDKDVPEIEIEQIARSTKTEHWTLEELKKQLVRQIHLIAHDALLEYDRNPDERQAYLVKIIRDHIKKRLLLGNDFEETVDERRLRILWAMIDQVREVFLRPELIEGIFTKR
jgi:superfamily II DNA or RNA helicase